MTFDLYKLILWFQISILHICNWVNKVLMSLFDLMIWHIIQRITKSSKYNVILQNWFEHIWNIYIIFFSYNDTIFECIFPNIKYHPRTIFESCYTVNHNSQNLDTGYNLSSCRMPLGCHLICLNQTSKS